MGRGSGPHSHRQPCQQSESILRRRGLRSRSSMAVPQMRQPAKWSVFLSSFISTKPTCLSFLEHPTDFAPSFCLCEDMQANHGPCCPATVVWGVLPVKQRNIIMVVVFQGLSDFDSRKPIQPSASKTFFMTGSLSAERYTLPFIVSVIGVLVACSVCNLVAYLFAISSKRSYNLSFSSLSSSIWFSSSTVSIMSRWPAWAIM